MVHKVHFIHSSEIAANAVLVLIGVTGSLLDRQLSVQADALLKEGGFSERLYKMISQKRKSDHN
ncbi:four helix bundle suffix domain-containing protein [bacterium]|nr:four helix bundle suffix domain-containing protein [bacterium]